jgi:hypothetical protein
MSKFSNRAASQLGSAMAVVAVTPSDDADLPRGDARSLYVGVAGELSFVDQSGAVVTIPSADMQYHPLSVKRVLQSGTTADRIFALY